MRVNSIDLNPGYVPQYRCKVPFCEDAAGAKFYTNASADNLKERYPDYVVAAIPEASLKTKSEVSRHCIKLIKLIN